MDLSMVKINSVILKLMNQSFYEKLCQKWAIFIDLSLALYIFRNIIYEDIRLISGVEQFTVASFVHWSSTGVKLQLLCCKWPLFSYLIKHLVFCNITQGICNHSEVFYC